MYNETFHATARAPSRASPARWGKGVALTAAVALGFLWLGASPAKAQHFEYRYAPVTYYNPGLSYYYPGMSNYYYPGTSYYYPGPSYYGSWYYGRPWGDGYYSPSYRWWGYGRDYSYYRPGYYRSPVRFWSRAFR